MDDEKVNPTMEAFTKGEQGDVELGDAADAISHNEREEHDKHEIKNATRYRSKFVDGNFTEWREAETTRSCSKDYQWNENSIIRNRLPSGKGQDILRGFNTSRQYDRDKEKHSVKSRGYCNFLFKMDWFHAIVESAPYKIVAVLVCYYVFVIFLFSLFWLVTGSNGDPCNTQILTFTDAFYFSLITFTTIGYGSASTFFNSCSSVSIIITLESFVGVVFNAIILGIVFGKIQRGATRGISICFSKHAIVREVHGKPYFSFRVVEQRKLQLVEAHIRCYAIFHERKGHKNEVHLFQQRPLRLNQPDDELGAMLLLMLPTNVVHRIDPWSPLIPPSCQPISSSGQNTFLSHQIAQRQGDADQGGSLYVECAVTGDGFSSEEAHKANHTFNDIPYPCEATPIVKETKNIIDSMEEYFINSEMEILILVEGIDPTMSTTLQSCYSYKSSDIKWNTHDFAPCVFRDTEHRDSGRPTINFEKFHELEEIGEQFKGDAGMQEV